MVTLPLKPIPIEERVSVICIERGEIDLIDGAFVVVNVKGIRSQIPVGGVAFIWAGEAGADGVPVHAAPDRLRRRTVA